MPWKTSYRFCWALALSITPAVLVRADERIYSFRSDIQVLQGGSLRVTETITVNAEGDQIKRGIYRDFSVAYTSRFLVPTKLPVHVVSVKRDGNTKSFHTKQRNNGIRVHIGRKNYRVPYGRYTYELTYTTNFQLGYFESHDELYWNVTGNG